MPIDSFNALSAQLTHDLFAIAKFLLELGDLRQIHWITLLRFAKASKRF